MFVFFYSFWLWATQVIFTRSFLFISINDPLFENAFLLAVLCGLILGFRVKKISFFFRRILYALFLCGLFLSALFSLSAAQSDAFSLPPFFHSLFLPLASGSLFLFTLHFITAHSSRQKILSLFALKPQAALFFSLTGSFSGIFYSHVFFLPLFGQSLSCLISLGGFLAVGLKNTKRQEEDFQHPSGDQGTPANVLPLKWSAFFCGFSLFLTKIYLDKMSPFFLGTHVYLRDYSFMALFLFTVPGIYLALLILRKKPLPFSWHQWALFGVILSIVLIAINCKNFAEITPFLDSDIMGIGLSSFFVLKLIEIFIALAPLGLFFGFLLMLLLSFQKGEHYSSSLLQSFFSGAALSLTFDLSLRTPLRTSTILFLSGSFLLIPVFAYALTYSKKCPLFRLCFMTLFSLSALFLIIHQGTLPHLENRYALVENVDKKSFIMRVFEDPLERRIVYRNEAPSLTKNTLLHVMEKHIGMLSALSSRPRCQAQVLKVDPQRGDQGSHWLRLAESEKTYDLMEMDYEFPVSGYEKIFFSQAFYRLCKKKLGETGILHQAVPVDSLKKALDATRSAFPYVKAFAVSRSRAHILAGSAPILAKKEFFERRMENDPAFVKSCQELDILSFDEIAAIMENEPEKAFFD
ncbi:MAG: hypothetical protein JW928_00505, partial [Candidatus Aureabacteria bacterium]|nr:hypothetical protein [Candidatus Auribacterota bacterium]